MYFLLDTCFIRHAELLYREKILDLRPILLNWNIATTHDVFREIKHYKLDSFIPIDELFLIPISQSKKDRYLNEFEYLSEFDEADLSLWICAYEEKLVVLTDDGKLFEELIQIGRNSFRLPLFIILSVELSLISKNAAFKCIKFWEKHSLYKKKALAAWRKEINAIK